VGKLQVTDNEVIGRNGQVLPYVHLPKAPAKKGTPAWREWAMEQFELLLRHGYNYSQAAEYLGSSYRWWGAQRERFPEWAARMEKVLREVQEGIPAHSTPDFSHVTFEDFLLTYAEYGYLPEHHQWICDALQDPRAKLTLILGHPESAKSTVVALWYVLYTLCKNPDARIALVSKSSSKAQDLLNRVKRYLTEEQLYAPTPENPTRRNLIKDFNGFRPISKEAEWSQDAIYIRQRQSGERDPSVQALGIGKQIYGARLDLLILDDSLVSDNQVSELSRERIDNWFTNEARSRAQRGQTVVCGTRLMPQDLYGQWKKSWAENKLFRGVYIPAIQDEYGENEKPTWHQYWTLDGYDITEEIDGEEIVVGYQPGLRDIRAEISSRDPGRWRMVYQQEDVEESESIFRQAHIDAALDLGAHRRLGQVFPHENLVLGVDPATTGRAAAVLLAVDPTTRIRTVVDIFVGGSLGATGIRQQLLYQFWDRYKDNRIGTTVIETNFAPTLLGDEAFLERAAAYGTDVRKHTTLGRGHKRGSKWDEEFGIAALASLFGGGLIAFANGGLDDRARLQPLIDDMLVFPWAEKAQDAIVALWIANGHADESSILLRESYEEMARRRGVPSGIVNRRVSASR
jgi:hypothetical protein